MLSISAVLVRIRCGFPDSRATPFSRGVEGEVSSSGMVGVVRGGRYARGREDLFRETLMCG